MAELVVEAQTRTELGKNANRRLRASGLIPGVIYGSGRETVHVSVDPSDVVRILHSESGHNSIFKLSVEKELADVLIKELQLDPLKGTLLHADFQTVALDQVMAFQVPVEIQGTAVGVKTQGGILDLVLREIDVECLPGDVPDNVPIDVTELNIGDSIRVSDLTLDSRIEIMSEADLVIAHVVAPRIEAEEEELEEEELEAGAEPELIKKGKAEEEGGGGTAPEPAPEE